MLLRGARKFKIFVKIIGSISKSYFSVVLLIKKTKVYSVMASYVSMTFYICIYFKQNAGSFFGLCLELDSPERQSMSLQGKSFFFFNHSAGHTNNA